MYMSHHPDTLIAYAKWYGKVKAPIVSAEMTDISTKARTITFYMHNIQKAKS